MKQCAAQRRKAARDASNAENAQEAVQQGFDSRARAYRSDGTAG